MRLPLWKCHKEVRAAKIERIEFDVQGNATLTLLLGEKNGVRGHTAIDMPAPWMERFKPAIGGYLVIYDDGYHSFSPERAFEEGYTMIEPL